MSINRHNYEEYFILYMDNELSSDDRRMVEDFIAQHPDLKDDLDQLQLFKLEPDNSITYIGKDELLKINNSHPVTLANYDECLLLYVDNELNAGQSRNVEQFLAENPSIATEFHLYKRCKLQPEPIVFAEKKSLYRKEEKVRRTTAIWWRAAAAVLLAIIGTTVFLVTNKSKNSNNDVVKNEARDEKKPGTDFQPKQALSEEPAALLKEKEPVALHHTAVINEAVKQPGNNTVVTNNHSAAKNKVQTLLPAPVKKEEAAVVAIDKPNNNLPTPLNNPYISNNNPANEKAIASIESGLKHDNKKDVLTNSSVTSPKLQPLNNTEASFASNTEQLDEPAGKKNKLRGFFRKITRTFEKRTNMEATDDDGKLLVAGLAIKLK